MENDNHGNLKLPGPQTLSPYSTPRYFAQPFERGNIFIDYWYILKKRKWWTIAFLLCVVVSTVIISLLMTPIYKATTILQITPDNPGAVMGDRDVFASLYASETQGRFYETQYMILNSRPMAFKLMESLKMTDSQEFQALKERYPEKPLEEIKGIFASSILGAIEVKPLKKSYLVEVAYQSPDKYLAQKVVSNVSKEYMRLAMESRRQSYEMVKNWLEGELQLLGGRVEDSESKLYAHGQKKDFLSLDDKDNTIINKYIELSKLLIISQSEKLIKEAQYKQVKGKGVNSPIITNNPLIQKLREQSISQEAKVSSLKKIYLEDHPKLQAERGLQKELNGRLDIEVKRVSSSIRADYEAARRAENLLSEALETQKTKVGKLQTNLVKHHILKRDMQANEQLYQALLARMKEASVASTMVASNVAVIAPAEVPFRPSKPQKRLYVLVSALFGLVGGIGLAFLVEYFDSTIKKADEMERFCFLPLLGMVPLLPQHDSTVQEKSDTSLAVYNQPQNMADEAIRQIRTSILLSSPGGPPAAIMMASPNPSEGKTTTAINLAITLAMNGSKVVLIDADLRKPNIHNYFRLPPQPGLSNFLTGNAPLEEILRPVGIPNLSLISGGSISPSPTELLTSTKFKNLLTDLRKEFQHLIIDTPPIIGFADGRVVSVLVEAVLLILRCNYTTKRSGLMARQLLSQIKAPVIGGILNMVPLDGLNYGGYKQYQKYYQNY